MRIHDDAVAGALGPTGLTTTATTMESAALADLRAIAAPDIAAATLYVRDADGRVTAKEIVHVTAHTAGATTATILRAQEGTTAQAWAVGDRWSHGATEVDWDDTFLRLGAAVANLSWLAGEWKAGARTIALAQQSTIANMIRWGPPNPVIEHVTMDRIAISVLTAGAGLARLGVYAGDATGRPINLIADCGEVDVSTTGTKEITLLSVAIDPYTVVVPCVVSNVSFDFRALNNHPPVYINSSGLTSPSSWQQSHTYGPLPDPATPVAPAGQYHPPLLAMRRAP